MKIIKKNKIFILISLILFSFSALFDTLNLLHLSAELKIWIGFIAMVLGLINAGFKQYISPDISNKSIYINIGLLVVYISGGVLNKMSLVPVSEDVQSIIRTILTFVTNFIPLFITKYQELTENYDKS